MPLEKGTTSTIRNHNISELINANKSKPEDKKRPMNQIEAIAYNEAKEKS